MTFLFWDISKKSNLIGEIISLSLRTTCTSHLVLHWFLYLDGISFSVDTGKLKPLPFQLSRITP